MKTYPPYDEEPMMASEPEVAYGSVAMPHASLYHPTPYELEVIKQSKKDFEEGRFYTQEEVDKMVEEWLHPFTMEELHQRMDEAEAEIEAGEVMTSEEANAEIRRLFPWLS